MASAKSILNELYQRWKAVPPVYSTRAASTGIGFECTLSLSAAGPIKEEQFEGSGNSKKEAEHCAANHAVSYLECQGWLTRSEDQGGTRKTAVGAKRLKEVEEDDTEHLEPRLLEALQAAYPKSLTAVQLAKMCGHFKLKSKVNHILYIRLRQQGLVELIDATPPPAWRATRQSNMLLRQPLPLRSRHDASPSVSSCAVGTLSECTDEAARVSRLQCQGDGRLSYTRKGSDTICVVGDDRPTVAGSGAVLVHTPYWDALPRTRVVDWHVDWSKGTAGSLLNNATDHPGSKPAVGRWRHHPLYKAVFPLTEEGMEAWDTMDAGLLRPDLNPAVWAAVVDAASLEPAPLSPQDWKGPLEVGAMFEKPDAVDRSPSRPLHDLAMEPLVTCRSVDPVNLSLCHLAETLSSLCCSATEEIQDDSCQQSVEDSTCTSTSPLPHPHLESSQPSAAHKDMKRGKDEGTAEEDGHVQENRSLKLACGQRELAIAGLNLSMGSAAFRQGNVRGGAMGGGKVGSTISPGPLMSGEGGTRHFKRVTSDCGSTLEFSGWRQAALEKHGPTTSPLVDDVVAAMTLELPAALQVEAAPDLSHEDSTKNSTCLMLGPSISHSAVDSCGGWDAEGQEGEQVESKEVTGGREQEQPAQGAAPFTAAVDPGRSRSITDEDSTPAEPMVGQQWNNDCLRQEVSVIGVGEEPESATDHLQKGQGRLEETRVVVDQKQSCLAVKDAKVTVQDKKGCRKNRTPRYKDPVDHQVAPHVDSDVVGLAGGHCLDNQDGLACRIGLQEPKHKGNSLQKNVGNGEKDNPHNMEPGCTSALAPLKSEAVARSGQHHGHSVGSGGRSRQRKRIHWMEDLADSEDGSSDSGTESPGSVEEAGGKEGRRSVMPGRVFPEDQALELLSKLHLPKRRAIEELASSEGGKGDGAVMPEYARRVAQVQELVVQLSQALIDLKTWREHAEQGAELPGEEGPEDPVVGHTTS